MNTIKALIITTASACLLSACASTEMENKTATEAKASEAPVVMTKTTEPMQKTAETAADPNKEVCKRQKVTGSRFFKKVCYTQAQWDEMAENGKKTASELQRRSGQAGTKPGGPG